MEIDWPSVLPDAPYAVYCRRPSDGAYTLLPFDLDDKAGDQVSVDLERLVGLLTLAGVRHVVVASRGAGPRRHVLARFPGGVPADEVAALGRALRRQCRSLDPVPLAGGRTAAIRPPLSPHRRGGRAKVIGDPMTALETLEEGNDRAAWERLLTVAGVRPGDRRAAQSRSVGTASAGVCGTTRPLPAMWERAWREGVAAPAAAGYGGTGRSELLAALAVLAVTHGWTREQFAARCRDEAQAGGDRARREHASWCRCTGGRHTFIPRPAHQVEAQIQAFWDRAVVFARPVNRLQVDNRPERPDQTLVDQRVAEVWEAIYQQPWRGRDGVHDKQLLLWLLLLVDTTGRLEVGGSVRSWATRAGMTKSTTARAIGRLCQVGWLRLAVPAAGPHGAVYELMEPPNYSVETHESNGTLALHPPVGTPRPQAPPLSSHLPTGVTLRAHDLWDWTGLGSTAGMLLSEVPAQGLTTAQLAQTTGLARSTTASHARRLTAAGLLSRRAGRWRHVEAADVERAVLDREARRLGCVGAHARRAARYQLDTLLYRWHQADHQARRGWAVERGHYHPEHAQLGGEIGGMDLPGFPRDHRGRPAWTVARDHMRDLIAPPERDRLAA